MQSVDHSRFYAPRRLILQLIGCGIFRLYNAQSFIIPILA